MKIQDNPYLPAGDQAQLVRQLNQLIKEIGTQLNQLSEGQVVAAYNAATAAPTGSAVSYNQGDFIRNLTPSVLGTAGSQYTILGWVCTVSGAPGTFVACRALTGT